MKRTRQSRYKIAITITSTCAACLLAPVWLHHPLAEKPWLSILTFGLICGISELLIVRMADESGVLLTPTAPLFWAATALMGPVPGFLAMCIAELTSMVGVDVAFYFIRYIERRYRYEIIPADGMNHADRHFSRFVDSLLAEIKNVGESWKQGGICGALQVAVQVLSCSIICMVAGVFVYEATGGRFLYSININSEQHLLTQFVLPFLLMSVCWCLVEQILYVSMMLKVFTPPEEEGLQPLIMAAKLMFIEIVLPIIHAHFCMSFVGMLLAYLYRHIGVIAISLTAMPILAMRDILKQWEAEKAAYIGTITTLAGYMQHYHPYTRGHLRRVAELCERLAREMKLSAAIIRHIGTAGLMHDIGKVAVPQDVLDKTGTLDENEWEEIKEHPIKGAEIISHIKYLDPIVDWIKYHHKWYNGAGYPPTREGMNIPVEAAIIAVADAFDAMIDDRDLGGKWACTICGFSPDDDSRPDVCPQCSTPRYRIYRKPKSLDEAIDELRRGAGWQFHPEVVKAFLSMIEREGVNIAA